MSEEPVGGVEPALFTFEHARVEGPHGPLLVDVDGEVPPVGVTVVVGPSGAGKSTLLRLCNRLEVPSAGRVLMRGRDLAGLDPRRLRRRVGMVFQRPTPFPGTVRENLGVAEPGLDDEAAKRLLERAELKGDLLDRPADELSGGEAQRVCLARTLATDPEVLLMDEPTSALDPQARGGLERLARDLVAGGTPILWVTHDLHQMRRLADHVLVLVAGRLCHAGPPDRLADGAPEEVVEFLRGDAPVLGEGGDGR